MDLARKHPRIHAALRLALGSAAALGLVAGIAQIPPGTISDAAPRGASSGLGAAVAGPMSVADEAACRLLHSALLRVARGMEFDRAFSNYAFVPWTAGQPSSRLRGVFASFHRATELQQNYKDGASSQQEAAEAFNSSVAAYAQLCEVRT